MKTPYAIIRKHKGNKNKTLNKIKSKGNFAVPSIENTIHNFAKYEVPKKQAFLAAENAFLLAGFNEKTSFAKAIKLINVAYPVKQSRTYSIEKPKKIKFKVVGGKNKKPPFFSSYLQEALENGIKIRSIGQMLAELNYSREKAFKIFVDYFTELKSKNPRKAALDKLKSEYDSVIAKKKK